MVKDSGHINDRETAFDNPSKMQPKRPHQWFVDGAEVEFFPNKKQAVEDANGKSSSGFPSASFSPWENNSNFHSVPNIGQLFGSETRQVNFIEKNASYVPADDPNVRSNMITNQYVDNASFGLSISHSVEDPEARRNVSGRKKVKVNQVKDSNGVRRPKGQNFNRQSNGDLHQAYGGEVEPRSASIGQAFDKDGNVTLMGLTYNRGDAHVRSFGTDSNNKEDTNVMSFGGFPNERDVARPAADYGQLYNQSSAHVPTTGHEKELDASNSDAVASTPKAAKVKSETVSKNKQESKATKKESPNSFPTNVRSLISTGILDGVPVKYVSVAREVKFGLCCLLFQFKVLFNEFMAKFLYG